MTGDCSIFNPVLLPYLPIYKTILSGFFSHAYFKRKVFFHQISKEKSAAYYIRARAIVGHIRYIQLLIITNIHFFPLSIVYWNRLPAEVVMLPTPDQFSVAVRSLDHRLP